ncbi:hypothetical protein B0H16DRAFT_1463235 [Mycena metata]|uniref:Uncharacterized protein n=1 Tax=Mycena metata TaxID=1033252 RepID=A0AAD7IJK1_9AGAR|nr:hypothetical protein B0H16DRAFT_1463235 [Mycena metata]
MTRPRRSQRAFRAPVLASAGNNKLKELRAELAILITASKIADKFFECCSRIAEEQGKIHCTSRHSDHGTQEDKKPAEGELDGIRMDSPEDDDDMVISLDDADLGVPSVNPTPLSTRRSTRKRGASQTHDNAPAPKLRKTEAVIAPEALNSAKKRGKRKHHGASGTRTTRFTRGVNFVLSSRRSIPTLGMSGLNQPEKQYPEKFKVHYLVFLHRGVASYWILVVTGRSTRTAPLSGHFMARHNCDVMPGGTLN